MVRLSALARNLTAETAFTVLARARALKAGGKDVVELEIGDSPFPSPPHAKAAGIRAIEEAVSASMSENQAQSMASTPPWST